MAPAWRGDFEGLDAGGAVPLGRGLMGRTACATRVKERLMRHNRITAIHGLLLAALAVSCASLADLQEVQVGGSIELYAAWYSEFFEPTWEAVRIPAEHLPGRAIGPNGTLTALRTDGTGNSYAFAEQRTRLHVDAAFSDAVRAFIEFDSIEVWGEDFASNYLTGIDARTPTDDDVEVYQAYIEASDLGGLPLRVRVGRQELVFGSGWLVGTNPDADPFSGLSFDAIRLTHEGEDYAVDLWASKLIDRSPLEEDGDTDFCGLYGTYAGIEGIELDLYYLFLRDAQEFHDTQSSWLTEWVEDILDLDDYSPTELHTLGARCAGERGAFDWDIEAAYQWGEADAVGAQFLLEELAYADDGASWDNWAGHGEVGYTFRGAYAPRVYIGAQYYGGEDRRDVSFGAWLNLFHRPKASVSFNRLFSDYEVDSFLDWSNLTNFWTALSGFSASPTDAIELGLDVAYLEVVEPFDWPAYIPLGKVRFPIAPDFSFWTAEGAKDLGWQTTLWGGYAYSEHLGFEVGWTHFFVGDAIEDGAFVAENGLGFVCGAGDHDADYVYVMTTVEF